MAASIFNKIAKQIQEEAGARTQGVAPSRLGFIKFQFDSRDELNAAYSIIKSVLDIYPPWQHALKDPNLEPKDCEWIVDGDTNQITINLKTGLDLKNFSTYVTRVLAELTNFELEHLEEPALEGLPKEWMLKDLDTEQEAENMARLIISLIKLHTGKDSTSEDMLPFPPDDEVPHYTILVKPELHQRLLELERPEPSGFRSRLEDEDENRGRFH